MLATKKDAAQHGKAKKGTSEDDVFDEFGLEAPTTNSDAVKESLKEIDDKIIKLKEKPFLKDIQGIELSQGGDQTGQIADNVASMVTSAIENYLGTIQVSEVPRL